MDIEQAFLNADLAEEVYVEQPRGFDDKTGRVCRLDKTLYGLKQSPREWQLLFTDKMEQQELLPTSIDPCVFTNQVQTIIMSVHVDDITIAALDDQTLERGKMAVCNAFSATDLGPPKQLLGMEIECTDRRVVFAQTSYVRKILDRVGMQDCRPVSTPIERLYDAYEGQASKGEIKQYQSIVGLLMFAALQTRPDIAFAVGHLARFAANPGPEHLTATKRVCRYLKGTQDLVLQLDFHDQSQGELDVRIFTDTDYAGDQTSRSTEAYVLMAGTGAISWRSGLQSCVALSTTEAEYMALTEAGKEAIWTQELLTAIGYEGKELWPMRLFEDNAGAIAIADMLKVNRTLEEISVGRNLITDIGAIALAKH